MIEPFTLSTEELLTKHNNGLSDLQNDALNYCVSAEVLQPQDMLSTASEELAVNQNMLSNYNSSSMPIKKQFAVMQPSHNYFYEQPMKGISMTKAEVRCCSPDRDTNLICSHLSPASPISAPTVLSTSHGDANQFESLEEHYLRSLWQGSTATAMSAVMFNNSHDEFNHTHVSAEAANPTVSDNLGDKSPLLEKLFSNTSVQFNNMNCNHDNMLSLGFKGSTINDEMLKKRRGRPPGSKNRPKGILTDEYGDHDIENTLYGQMLDDTEPPNKKRRGRPPGSKNRFSGLLQQYYGNVGCCDNVDGNVTSCHEGSNQSEDLVSNSQNDLQDSDNTTDEIFEDLPPIVTPIQIHQLSSEPLRPSAVALNGDIHPKPGSIGVSRFSERVVASLSRYLGTKGGDLRLGCDEHGMEVFIVRCQYCARDVRLSGRRTWNFTGVHIPRCIKHGFRKADDLSSTPAPPGRPPTSFSGLVSNLSNNIPISTSSESYSQTGNLQYGNSIRECNGSNSLTSSCVNEMAAREARLAVVAAAAAAGVFPGLKHGVPPTIPQAAAAAAALMNLQHTANNGMGHHMFLPSSSSSHLNSVNNTSSSPHFCLSTLANCGNHHLIPFSSNHLIPHYQSPHMSLAYNHQQHDFMSLQNDSLAISGSVPHPDNMVSLQHAQFNVVAEIKDVSIKQDEDDSGRISNSYSGMDCTWHRKMDTNQMESHYTTQLHINIKSDSDSDVSAKVWN